MPTRLQIDQPMSEAPQNVTDQNGTASPLALSSGAVEIRTGAPTTEQRTPVPVAIAGDVRLEYNGSPQLVLYSRGNGTQRFSIRATNDKDAAGGRRLVIRNESQDQDLLTLESGGISTSSDLKIERNGSPQVVLYSRGNGTQRFSIRATNDKDAAGGRRLVIRNESQGRDEITLDSQGRVTVSGDIVLAGADCAEAFPIDDPAAVPAGSVMVIGSDERLHQCTQPYDRRVAGVISGAAGHRPGIVLGVGSPEDARLPLALNGRVLCQVDATPAPIGTGDLLTTSSYPGHAMKATDHRLAFGAVIGKAMRPLTNGRGLVPVLVALQ
jgi:hypothetical protein